MERLENAVSLVKNKLERQGIRADWPVLRNGNWGLGS